MPAQLDFARYREIARCCQLGLDGPLIQVLGDLELSMWSTGAIAVIDQALTDFNDNERRIAEQLANEGRPPTTLPVAPTNERLSFALARSRSPATTAGAAAHLRHLQ